MVNILEKLGSLQMFQDHVLLKLVIIQIYYLYQELHFYLY